MKFTIHVLTFSLFLSPLLAQEDEASKTKQPGETEVKKEEVFRKDGKVELSPEQTRYEIGILIEYISVKHTTANEMIQQFGDQPNDVSELRDRLEEMLDKEEAELIETTWIRACSGMRAKTESIREFIYPSEYDPAEIPNYVGNSRGPAAENSKYANVHLTSANPTAFECRNTGTTFEVDPVISANLEAITLNLAPELVTRLDDRYHLREGHTDTARGIEHIATPTFYTIKDTTQIDVAPGDYNLLGVHTPHDKPSHRILTLIRADLIPIN